MGIRNRAGDSVEDYTKVDLTRKGGVRFSPQPLRGSWDHVPGPTMRGAAPRSLIRISALQSDRGVPPYARGRSRRKFPPPWKTAPPRKSPSGKPGPAIPEFA